MDCGIVKPGILARQNFSLHDVGSKKAEALAARLRSISVRTQFAFTADDAQYIRDE